MEKKFENLPEHIAIIMDGNGRWANKRGLPRTAGHAAGAEAFRRTAKYCRTLGVEYLTVYAFSTENWGRPKQEVEALMALICRGVEMESDNLREAGVKVRVMGRRQNFSPEVAEAIRSIEEQTAAGERLTLILALDYSSRSEICDAVREIARRVKQGEMEA